MSEQKTHAEIIAEMRYKAGVICPWQVNGGTCELCPLGHSPHGKDLGKYCSFHKLAYELDAAHNREVDALKQRCAELDAEIAAKDEVIQRLNDALAEEQRRKMATAENSSAVGDAAKLREAAEVTLTTIKKCMDILNSIPSDCGYGGLVEDVGDELCGLRDDFINAALAAPLRNCDVGTAEEQAKRFGQFCWDNHSEKLLCSKCPLGQKLGNDVDCCQIHWAQMPYTESEATDGE